MPMSHTTSASNEISSNAFNAIHHIDCLSDLERNKANDPTSWQCTPCGPPRNHEWRGIIKMPRGTRAQMSINLLQC